MDINEILAKVGITVSEEKVDEFNKLVRTNYKSLAEVNKLRNEIEGLKEKNSELEKNNEEFNKVKSSNSDLEAKYQKEVNELKGKLTDYENKFKGIEVDNAISKAFEGLKFTSKRVQDSVYNEIKSKGFELKEGKLEGIDSYIEELKKEENIFETSTKKPTMHVGQKATQNEDENRTAFLNALFEGMEDSK